MADDHTQFKVRLVEPLRSKLTGAAGAADRTINSEILWRLEQSLEPEWPDYIAKIAERQQHERTVLEHLRQDPDLAAQISAQIDAAMKAKANKPTADKPQTVIRRR
jgi:hypothetical protein